MAEADTTVDTTEIPRRFWWLKRIGVVVLVLGGILVGLRYWALAVAKRRLEAEIDGINARGEPLAPEDFLEQPVTAEEDAGPDLLAAGTMFVVPSQHLLAWNNINTP